MSDLDDIEDEFGRPSIGLGPDLNSAIRRRRAMAACTKGHPYTKENTRIHIDKKGRKHRVCRQCAAERQRLAAERKGSR